MNSARTDSGSNRQCQPCTACCDGWVRIEIDGMAVYPGHPCPHSTGSGCRIYAERPVDPCVNFECGWRKSGSPLPEWMRPDVAGVMLLPDVRRWQGLAVDVAVPVGACIPPRSLDWLKRHAEQSHRPLIYLEQNPEAQALQRDQNVIAYGPPEFQAEIVRMLRAGERIW